MSQWTSKQEEYDALLTEILESDSSEEERYQNLVLINGKQPEHPEKLSINSTSELISEQNNSILQKQTHIIPTNNSSSQSVQQQHWAPVSIIVSDYNNPSPHSAGKIEDIKEQHSKFSHNNKSTNGYSTSSYSSPSSPPLSHSNRQGHYLSVISENFDELPTQNNLHSFHSYSYNQATPLRSRHPPPSFYSLSNNSTQSFTSPSNSNSSSSTATTFSSRYTDSLTGPSSVASSSIKGGNNSRLLLPLSG
jgi:hypothetical protein